MLHICSKRWWSGPESTSIMVLKSYVVWSGDERASYGWCFLPACNIMFCWVWNCKNRYVVIWHTEESSDVCIILIERRNVLSARRIKRCIYNIDRGKECFVSKKCSCLGDVCNKHLEHTLRHEYASCSPLPYWPFHQRSCRALGDARLALQKGKQKKVQTTWWEELLPMPP